MRFARFIVKKRGLILAIAVVLAVLSVFGLKATKINYDILTYLPGDLNSIVGEKALDEDFHIASTAMVTVEGMSNSEILELKEQFKQIEGVNKVYWIDDVADLSIPKEMLPEDLKNTFYGKESTLIIVTFEGSTSSESTMNAIGEMKKLLRKDCLIGGMSAVAEDTRALTDSQVPIYILIAVILVLIVLFLGVDSNVTPFLIVLGIGFAVLFNFGSNILLGQISYVTESLAAVLQLGVTMDFSIFLIHRYEDEKCRLGDKEEAMTVAIARSFVSIFGSSLTAIAGFLALCTMSLTLGYDIGIVMAKGVFLGVICTFTILPSLLLIFDEFSEKHKHKTLIRPLTKTSDFIVDHHVAILLVFIAVLIPFVYGKYHVKEYYNLIQSLPSDLISVQGTNRLKDDYGMQATDFILVDENLKSSDIVKLTNEIEALDGVTLAVGYKDYVGGGIPSDVLPDNIKNLFVSGGRQLLIVNSEYIPASDEQNAQLEQIGNIVKKYDPNALITGEAPMNKDLVTIAGIDFKNVDTASIVAVFIIIALIFRSVSLPVILVATIESAVMINMGIPYFTGSTLPFIAGIVIGTIQLGSTINYAILLTNRYREELICGYDAKEATRRAVEISSRSVFSSGLAFFAATFGVSVYSNVDLIKSLCLLIARGAIVSMFVIIFVLPALLIIFAKLIEKTSYHWLTPNAALAEDIAAKPVGEQA
ncbi:MAG: efflux RND transporter permease subunit [Oscillospiraceae bacterium]|jgi:predicted RND superfamily exporter protein